MKFHVEEITFSTRERFQLIDLTYKVEEVVKRSGIRNGLCLIYAPHATAAIIANEHERGLLTDILSKLRELFPPDIEWKHNLIDDNAHAHVASSIVGTDRVFPVINGRLVRGTWQNIFFVEMDGPRNYRKVLVVVIGE
mgnify:CR=1 FL=1